ncbi:MAG TPA: hypothetical protein VGL92_09340 [Acidimicrobiia bacterium]
MLTAGPAAAAAFDPWSSGPRILATVVLWGVWGAVLVATLVPRPAGLTALRVAASLAVLLAAGATREASAGASVAALAGTLAMAGLALHPAVGFAFVNGAAYGDERRFPLRLPPALLLGPLPLAVPLLGLGATAGPLLLAGGHPVPGILALVVGWPLAAGLARSLYSLSQRWAVLVPAGIVLKDPLALADPVLFPRERVASLRPLPYPAAPADDVCDLRLGAVAGSLVLELTEEVTLVRTNLRRRGGEIVRARRLAFSPRLPDLLLADATRRRTASPG